MPRTKQTNNPFGSILKKQITKHGRKIFVWDVRKRYTGAGGEKKVKFKRCYSASEAQIALTNFQTEIKKERSKAAEEKEREHTLFELIEYFRTEYCKEAVIVEGRQVSGYRQSIKKIEAYLDEYEEYFGNVKLSEITYEKIRRFAEHLYTTPCKNIYGGEKFPKPATVNRKLSYLRRILNIGIRLRWLAYGINPFNEGEPLILTSLEQPRDRILTFEEENRLLELCEQDKLTIKTERAGKSLTMVFDNPYKKMKLVLILAIDSGLRHKELLSLQRENIFLDEKYIHLPAKKTKSLKERFIPISERLETELRRYFKQNVFAPNDLIFFGQKSLEKSFEGLCRHAGVSGITFHALRHTATTWMNEAGISDAVKRNIVGHSSETVHQRYHNLSSDILETARAKMNEFRKNLTRKVNGKVKEEKAIPAKNR